MLQCAAVLTNASVAAASLQVHSASISTSPVSCNATLGLICLDYAQQL